jgi:hypothetical protein
MRARSSPGRRCADTRPMRFAALLVVLAVVGWLTMRETTGAGSPPGTVSSASQGQQIVDDARRQVNATTP